MDEKLKNDEKKVMLVEGAKDGKLKAVTATDEDGKSQAVTAIDQKGNVKTTEPNEQNLSSLLNVNTNESFMEAFFKKFLEQADNPAHTGIFIMSQNALEKLIKVGFGREELEQYRVDPAKELQNLQEKNIKQEEVTNSKSQKQDGTESQTFQPMDIEKIDHSDLERKGIRMEDLEPHLKAMSYGHKSNGLIEMNPEMEAGGVRVPTKGRVSLEEQADGSLKVVPHYRQEKPNLDIPIHGVLLDEKTKENLLKTGNAGQVVDLELTPGKKEPCYLTLDKLTNKLEVLPTSEIKLLNQIKGKELTQGQQLDFAAGRKVLVEGMTSRSGRLFDGHIQVNAADKKIEFSYEGLDRKRYAQENKQIRNEQKGQSQEKKEPKQENKQDASEKQLFIPKKLLGVELNEKQTALLQAGKATYVKGMVKDAQGEPFNAWVKPNPDENKLNFYKWNPDYAKKQGAEVKPANESKTQVAVNSEGKTNEATKNVKEPLRQGQQSPTDKQTKQQEQKQEAAKPVIKKKSGPKL
ncbi:DUF3945 domain-containing protein [Bacteroidales bacterium OttesenSCG-928-J19]|nr:DUF3945 domain-containing protein [Bacteroidales bacterium OttesenSCG-928-J19]